MLRLLNLVKKSALPRLTGYDPVIREVADPDHVVLPLEYPGQVHYFPVVKAGETVRKGQPVAKSRNGNSVIASISGKVREIKSVWTAQSVHSPAIIIDGDGGPPLTPEEMFDGPRTCRKPGEGDDAHAGCWCRTSLDPVRAGMA